MRFTPPRKYRSQESGQRRSRPGRARRWLPASLAVTLAGCNWIGLGWGAVTYPTTADGEAANVAVHGDYAYATRGAQGIEVIALDAPSQRHTVAAPADTTVDDLAIADGLLFALDARPPGHLAVYSLAEPARPVLVQAPVMTEVGPFSGVSAAAGLVVVSGGTSRLSLRRYTNDGQLGAGLATADLGRGQPDVLIAPDGNRAYVSVHDDGPHFSLVVIALAREPLAIRTLATLPLDTYGFTPGGAKPASFPIEMALDGEQLIVASAAGLQVFDVADPALPRALATLRPEALPVNVDARDGLAVVVGSEPRPRLTLVDLADPANPKVIHSILLTAGSHATGVALGRQHVAVAAHAAGTLVFTLDDLTR